jgi:hypothetical protein
MKNYLRYHTPDSEAMTTEQHDNDNTTKKRPRHRALQRQA